MRFKDELLRNCMANRTKASRKRRRKRGRKRLLLFNKNKLCVICNKPFGNLGNATFQHITPRCIRLKKYVFGLAHKECNAEDSKLISKFLDYGTSDDIIVDFIMICSIRLKMYEIRDEMLNNI